MSESTIVAPATAPGRGGISIIRLSGPKSLLLAEDLCGELGSPRKFKFCKIIITKYLICRKVTTLKI